MAAPYTDYIAFLNDAQQVIFRRKDGFYMIDVLKYKWGINKEINFTEEKLFDTLEKLLCDDNIDRGGAETDALIQKVISYIKSNEIAEDVTFSLCDYCTEIGDVASTYGFKQGFKEGIRSFRTLMRL